METSHAERSPLNCLAYSNTEDGERRGVRGRQNERDRGARGRAHTQQQKEREREERGGGDSLDIVVTLETSHAERSPLN